jgi:hypothetical protein
LVLEEEDTIEYKFVVAGFSSRKMKVYKSRIHNGGEQRMCLCP